MPPLNAVGLHIHVLLDLARQLLSAGRKVPAQEAREDIQFLEIRVGEGQDLRQEGVEPDVVGQLAPAVRLLVLRQLHKPIHHRPERGIKLILCGLGIEVETGEGIHLRPGEDVEVEELTLEVVKEVRVGGFRKERPLVVRLEGLLDVVGLIGEVQDHRLGLIWVGPVQPRKGLDRVDPAQLLVHVHGVKEGFVVPGLELLRAH